jgi:hypothetical protein
MILREVTNQLGREEGRAHSSKAVRIIDTDPNDHVG